MITVETDLGTIKVAKNVLGNIIYDVIDSFDGKVILSNSKGKIPNNQLAKKLTQKEEFDGLSIELIEDALTIKIHVVLRFGTSIRNTTAKMIEEIRRLITESTGMEVKDVTIFVTGMLSKHIAPRNIEVRG